MTRTITLVAAIGSMLLLVPAAWGKGQSVSPPDAFERAAAAQISEDSVVLAPDAFELAVAARETAGRTLVFDNYRASEPRGGGRELVFDNYRVESTPSSGSSSARGSEASGSETQIEWAQVGLGLALGIVLMIGLYIGLRGTRQRPLAH